ncbi:fimbrillin family protein [uncultured Bacteroides sp.]|uniref:fimbrillin family protein n=1 Tax=uncultured Bacteroides sp. TaxID=162156 RepID=UPI0025D2AA53|nr:fimbrillin family protein [uncultured Bacteroides sp.]
MNLKHLFFLAVAGTVAVACSEVNESSFTEGDGQKRLSTISSGNDRFSTRLNSETSEWESGDAIGIYMFDTEGKNVLNNALNVQYTTIGNGLTVNFSSNPGIAIYDMPTNFVAYYPYTMSADVIDATAALYKVDLSNQSNGISAHDLMWAKAANQSTESLLAGGLAFTFHHQLVLLRVNITNENVADVTSVTVGGMNTTATFDLIDGTLSNMGTQKSVDLQKKDSKSFIGIMLPAEELIDKLTLTIVADGSKYQYTVPETSRIDKFVAGNEYTFNITVGKETTGEIGGGNGSNTPWGDGGSEDGDGDKVSENEAIPADYAQKAVTAETDLATVLSGASGKVALVFAANEEGYTFSDAMEVPGEVTELLLIGDTEKQVKMNLKQIRYSGLQKIALNNLDITGSDNSTALMTNNEAAQLSTDAVINLAKCNFTNMKTVCDWPDGDNGAQNLLSAVVIDDCQFINIKSVFNYYGSKAITITNSTLYNMTDRAVYVKDANNVAITVENCTLVGLTATPFESRYNNGNLYYKNNVSACFVERNPNIGYKMTVQEFSGNYAAASEDGKYAVVDVHGTPINTDDFPNAWINTSMTVSELFEDAANGNFKLKIDAQAGDPRWYRNAE